MVIAYIQPFMAEAVVKALQKIPQVTGASVVEARGFGRGRGKGESNALMTENGLFGTLRKLRIETVIPDALEELVVKTIRETARTGHLGDGKIYVTDIHRAVRIRTGEEGEAGL